MSIKEIGDVLTGLKNQSLLGKELRREQTTAWYDPNKSPPDFDLAKKHGKAKKVYKPIEKEDEIREACPCCQLPLKGEQIPLSANLSELYHLGSGYPLYFQFIKYSIALLILLFIGGGMFGIITNGFGDSCADLSEDEGVNQYCVKDFVGRWTIANKRDKESALEMQLILNFVTIVLTILFFHYIRYEVRKMKIEADDRTTTPSDYTVKLSGIPLDLKSQELKTWIENLGTKDDPIVVRKITRSYDIIEYTQLIQERETLIYTRNNENDEGSQKVLDAQIQELNNKLRTLKTRNLKFARVAYVTLETAHQAHEVTLRFQKGLFNTGVRFMKRVLKHQNDNLCGKKVKVKRAPEPSDVLWENLGFSANQKLKRKIFTTIMAGILVTLSFGIIIAISWSQNHILKKIGEGSPFIKLLSIAASFILATLNYILGQLIRKLAEFEKHGTYTGYFTGITRKLSIAQFINTAFTTLIAKIVITASVAVGDHTIIETVNFYGVGGLLEAMFFVFITNAFSTPLMNFFDPFYYLKLFQRWRALRNQENSRMTQKEAQVLFEDPQVDMSYKYALLIKTMLLTAFYAPAIPISIILAVVGLVFVYWVDKYILLRRSALPFSLGSELTESMLEYLEWMTFMYAVGNLLIVYSLEDSTDHLAFRTVPKFWVWATLIVSILHIFLPMDLINQKLLILKDEVTENLTYDKARFEFYTDYDIENPITRERGLRDFRRALKGENIEKTNLLRRFKTKLIDDEESHLVIEETKDHDDDDDGKKINDALFGMLEHYAKTTNANPILARQESQSLSELSKSIRKESQ